MIKILIAEDDPVMLEAVAQQLAKESYDVLAVADGKEAFSSLTTFKPDLIITDILMPYTSGLELIGIVRADSDKKIPILVLSALDEESVILEAFSLGADDFITKPFNPSELSMRVKRLINMTV